MKGTSPYSEDFLKEVGKTTNIFHYYNVKTLFVGWTQVLIGFGKKNDVKNWSIRVLFVFNEHF